MSSDPSNMANFTTNSYNLTVAPQPWCVKPGSIYTNPNANYDYFNTKCGDPYTYYGYWYRRFPGQTNYLNCYYLPYKSPYFSNNWGYVKPGSKCHPVPNRRYNGTYAGFKVFDSKINTPY